jgi:putative hydrolase of the HAD superfamily
MTAHLIIVLVAVNSNQARFHHDEGKHLEHHQRLVIHCNSESRPWIIFDGDNTLWHVEALYDQARSALCKLIASTAVTEDDVSRYQQRRDKQLFSTMGYSVDRFPQSFADSLLHFEPNAQADRLRAAQDLARRVFEEKAELAHGVDEVLETLSSRYRLAILTAGEHHVQARRLQHFGRQHYFEWISVVPNKSVAVLQALADKYKIEMHLSWMIGDSVRSDIIPASQAGMRTIWVKASNWTLVEHEGHEIPPGTPEVSVLSELLGILGIAT